MQRRRLHRVGLCALSPVQQCHLAKPRVRDKMGRRDPLLPVETIFSVIKSGWETETDQEGEGEREMLAAFLLLSDDKRSEMRPS